MPGVVWFTGYTRQLARNEENEQKDENEENEENTKTRKHENTMQANKQIEPTRTKNNITKTEKKRNNACGCFFYYNANNKPFIILKDEYFGKIKKT